MINCIKNTLKCFNLFFIKVYEQVRTAAKTSEMRSAEIARRAKRPWPKEISSELKCDSTIAKVADRARGKDKRPKYEKPTCLVDFNIPQELKLLPAPHNAQFLLFDNSKSIHKN